jgi:hypothetical protein
LDVGDFGAGFSWSFSATARLLSVAWYGRDAESQISPVDVAISWGRMSDSKNIDALRWTHDTRFLTYYYDQAGPPIPIGELQRSVANVHIIPAYDGLLKKIEKLRAGQKITLSGKLVNVERGDGWRWNSSLTRTDDGAGACEVMWLEQIDIAP